jgi:tetratricopeptide (TPR) repeat protein
VGRRRWLAAGTGLLLALTLAVFGEVADHGFVAYDDGAYLVENRMAAGGLTPTSLRWALTTRAASNWHPLTWISHLAAVSLFGMDPGPHHLLNLALHLGGALLLFRFLRAATGRVRSSLLASLLFALHPRQVESVAWISQRKDVLAGLLGFATLLAWLRYRRRPGPGPYAVALAAVALGLATKPTLVILPLLFLVLDHWPLGAAGHIPRARLLLEKVPFLLLALGAGFLTILAQRGGGAMEEGIRLGPAAGLAAALVAGASYLSSLAWPVGLAYFYPLPREGYAPWLVLLSALILAGVTLAAWALCRRGPWLAAGWAWFLVALAPVSGFPLRAGAQAMADRYTYLPAVGLFVALAWGMDRLAWRRLRLSAAAGVAAASLVLLLAGLSRRQVSFWRDSVSLFGRAVAAVPGNWPALNSLGVELARQGRLPEARERFRQSLAVNPGHVKAHYNLALALELEGREGEALWHYQAALALDPGHAPTLERLATIRGRAAAGAAGDPGRGR